MTRDLKRLEQGALGDMWYLNGSGVLVKVGGTLGTGKVPTVQSGGTVDWATPPGAAAAFATLTSGTSITWATAGATENNALLTLAHNATLSITGAVNGASGLLILTQDATGSRTFTLPGGTVLGSTTSVNPTASKKTGIAWTYDGSAFTFWLGRES